MLPPPSETFTRERELPMLAGIGAFVTWCEDLLAILSGPILTFGLGIALVALLTDGQLLVRMPALLWVWAVSQAVGLDAQFIGASAKLARAIRRRATWPILGYILLCGALGYVGFLASDVFATQEANGFTTAEALSRLGMDATSWLLQRSLLAVVLVFLSGFLRYVAPSRDVALDAATERAKLETDIELAPLRQQLRAQQARGARGVVAAALGREQPLSAAAHRMTQEHAAPAPAAAAAPALPDDDPPDGPDGSDPTASHQRQKAPPAPDIRGFIRASYSEDTRAYTGEHGNGHRPINMHRSASAKRARRRIVSDGLTTRQLAQRSAAYALLDAQPTLSQRKLAAEIKCGPAQAKRYKQMWLARNAQRAAVASAAE